MHKSKLGLLTVRVKDRWYFTGSAFLAPAKTGQSTEYPSAESAIESANWEYQGHVFCCWCFTWQQRKEMQQKKHFFLEDKDTLADVGNSSKSEAPSVLLSSAQD